MNRQTMKKISIAFIIVLMIVGYIIRVVSVNANAFRVNKRVYEVGEECIFNDYKYRVLECQIMTSDDIKNLFEVSPSSPYDFEVKYVATKIEVAYTGLEDEKTILVQGYYSAGAWSNGTDYNLGYMVNVDNKITKGTKKEIWVFGVLPEGMFASWEWKDIENTKFNLILQTLPEEVRLKCN